MKVSELIAELSKYDGDMEVVYENSEFCYGDKINYVSCDHHKVYDCATDGTEIILSVMIG